MNRFFLVVAVALMVSSTAVAGTQAAHFRGALLDADTPVRLQKASVYFQADAPPPPPPPEATEAPPPGSAETPVEQMTREQLQAEYQRLEREQPSLGGPIALTAVGGALCILSLPFLYSALVAFGASSTAVVTAGFVFLAFAAALGITGAVLLPIGLVRMFRAIGERRTASQRMDDINARLESLDQTGAPPPPPPPTDIPPPPPPPGAGFFDVKPQYVVATF